MSDHIPEFDQGMQCPNCKEKGNVMTGYGMFGGGMGPYVYCDTCGKVIAKSQDPEMCESHDGIIDAEFTEVPKEIGNAKKNPTEPTDKP